MLVSTKGQTVAIPSTANRKLTKKVTCKKEGKTIAKASVTILQIQKGSVIAADGNFSIVAQKEDVLFYGERMHRFAVYLAN